jgi:hypothetical protein
LEMPPERRLPVAVELNERHGFLSPSAAFLAAS